jgi:hypothetical protein
MKFDIINLINLINSIYYRKDMVSRKASPLRYVKRGGTMWRDPRPRKKAKTETKSKSKKKRKRVSLKNRLTRHVKSFKEGDAIQFGNWKIGIIADDRDMSIEDRKYDHRVFIPVRRGPRGKVFLVRTTTVSKLPQHTGTSFIS